MREKTLVSFKIQSAAVTAEQLQAKLGLKPDDAWKAGDPRGTFATKEKQHGFVLDSRAPISATAEEHVKELLKRLQPCAAALGELAPQATISLVVELHRKGNTALLLDRDDVRWLGVMGARLELDAFVAAEPARPAPAKKPGAGA